MSSPSFSTLPATEVPDELPRSIARLFWLFARGRRATVLLMMLLSLSLRALSVLQFGVTSGLDLFLLRLAIVE